MIVLVDTTIWSLALRRRPEVLSERERSLVDEWARLVRSGEAVLIGPIRQEVLSGIRDSVAFTALRDLLGDFRYVEILPPDYDEAARLFNLCRSRGITGTATDLLICAIARRVALPIFTLDTDFDRFAPIIGIDLHSPSGHY